MSLARRRFLRVSALGTASLVLPLGGIGCGGALGLPTEVRAQRSGELLFFDRDGTVFKIEPASHRVVVAGRAGSSILGRLGTGPA
jgi:hypothetical protein